MVVPVRLRDSLRLGGHTVRQRAGLQGAPCQGSSCCSAETAWAVRGLFGQRLCAARLLLPACARMEAVPSGLPCRICQSCQTFVAAASLCTWRTETQQ